MHAAKEKKQEEEEEEDRFPMPRGEEGVRNTMGKPPDIFCARLT